MNNGSQDTNTPVTAVAPLQSSSLPTSPTDVNATAHPDDLCVNVYVANLPQSADAKSIRQTFAAAGKVLHVKLLLDIATGTSRGIAFVMFEDLATAKKVCTMKNRSTCNGNVLQVRLAERSSQHQNVNSHARANVVYVRNVPSTINCEKMKAHCTEQFGRVIEVTPHPQSAELGGPSPFNMLFVSFENIDEACICTEELDGKSPFPIPSGHPFTMAKMITDVAGEMRKSILLRRRSSDGSSVSSPKQSISPTSNPFQANMVQQMNMQQPLTVDALNALQQHQQISNMQRRISQTSTDSFGVPVQQQQQPVMMAAAPQQQQQQQMVSPNFQRRMSGGSDTSIHSNGIQQHHQQQPQQQLPTTTFLPVVYTTNELPVQQHTQPGVQTHTIVHHPQPVQQAQPVQPQMVIVQQQPGGQLMYASQPPAMIAHPQAAQMQTAPPMFVQQQSPQQQQQQQQQGRRLSQ